MGLCAIKNQCFTPPQFHILQKDNNPNYETHSADTLLITETLFNHLN